MVRNKDGNFPGDREIEDPKAKAAHSPLKPNGQTAPRPQERMAKRTE
ncbi:small acid-soluble spore protein K [Ammoniphilus sp. 3BR4]